MTDELRKLAEAATPGPWRAWFSDTAFSIQTSGQEKCPLQAYIAKGSWWAENSATRPGEQQAKTNAAFIAAASPDVVLGLLDEIRRISVWGGQAELAKTQALIEERDEAREAVKRLAWNLEEIARGGLAFTVAFAEDALADPVVKRIVERTGSLRHGRASCRQVGGD